MGDATSDTTEPAMTVREMVREVYADVKIMRTDLGILTAANLPARVTDLEGFRSALTGGDRRVGTVDQTIRGWTSTVVAIVALAIVVLSKVAG